MSADIDPTLKTLAEQDPSAIIEAIIRAAGTLDALLERLPTSLIIQHTYRIVPGVAVSGPVGEIRDLAALAVVRSIEPVRAVHHS